MAKTIREKQTHSAGITIGSFTTTQRNALTPSNGDVIYNSTLGAHQMYQNGAWVTPATLSDIALKMNIDGWIPDANTWTYSSVSGKSSIVTVNADVTANIFPGDRIKLTNSSLTQNFIVTKISFSAGTTTITMYGGNVPIVQGATGYTNAGGARTSIAVLALEYAVPNGATLKFPNGDTATVSSGAAVAATSISITSVTPSTTNGGWVVNEDINATNYILANSAITNVYYSHEKSPAGFNTDPRLWTESFGDVTQPTQAAPVGATWYNLNALQLLVPIGAWELDYAVSVYVTVSNNRFVGPGATLSKANNTEDDAFMTCVNALVIPTAGAFQAALAARALKRVLHSSATTYYLNVESFYGNVTTTTLGIESGLGNGGRSSIRAKCAYL